MASSSGRKSGRIGGEVAAAARKERRFEDIVSDEEDEEDVLPSFLQKGKGVSSNSGKRAQHSPPRKPRSSELYNCGTRLEDWRLIKCRSFTALHEQIGEDGFIFSIAAPAASKPTKPQIPGAKGPPPSQASTSHQSVREKIAEAETPVIRRNQQKRAEVDAALTSDEEHFQPSGTNRRQLSDSVKRIRRTSQLHDGTPAYPHPSISDEDLHNYCSGDLEPQERMKHVAGWILERRRKEIKSKLQGKSAGDHKGALLSALKTTLRDLNKGVVHTSRQQNQHPSSSSSSSQGSNGVPKKRRKLPAHPRNEANREKKRKLEEVVQNLKREKDAWERERRELDGIKRETDALARRLEDKCVPNIDELVDSLEEEGQWNTEDRKRLQMLKKALDNGIDHIGTEVEDPRWNDVEFNADLLRSKAHTFAQLSSLSQRYIAAVSARGAKALKEMTEGPSHTLRGTIGGPSSTSTISRESQDNLDQILSEIRTITDEGDDEEGVVLDRGHGHAVGDASEGEILRAYAQMS
jgi:hypothetical protein